MKALTVWQPWAQLLAMGTKSIETRSWGTMIAMIPIIVIGGAIMLIWSIFAV